MTGSGRGCVQPTPIVPRTFNSKLYTLILATHRVHFHKLGLCFQQSIHSAIQVERKLSEPRCEIQSEPVLGLGNSIQHKEHVERIAVVPALQIVERVLKPTLAFFSKPSSRRVVWRCRLRRGPSGSTAVSPQACQQSPVPYSKSLEANFSATAGASPVRPWR